jgi:Flp pilus assembly protein TadG
MLELKILAGWAAARLERMREDERGVTVEFVLWTIFLIGAVGLVSAAVMAYLNTKIAQIH